MDVLLYLAAHQGEVVSREELEKEVWRDVIVGYDAITATVLKLRKALQDDAKNPQIVKTVPKRGYQLVAPVISNRKDTSSPISAAHSEGTPTNIQDENSATVSTLQNRQSILIASITVVSLVLIFLTMLWTQSPKQVIDTPTSIVVIPIENLGNSEQYEIFVDGITDDIITDLSRIATLKVFASATSFNYKGQQVTPQLLREELGVDYVLTGNARRQGEDIRINIQLTNTESGTNVWAQRYARKAVDVFAMQDDITNRIIEKLAVKLSPQEKQNLSQRTTDNLEAYEHFLQGQRVSRQQTRQSNALAREAYRRAIELDPTYGRAYGALAYTLALDYRHGWTDTPLQNLDRALELAQKGLSFDDAIPQTYWSLGYVFLRRKEYHKALKASEDAIRVSPSYADGYGLLALINNGLGKADKALEYATRGMQLNPYYTWDYLFNAGFAHYMMGNYEKAIEFLEKAQTRNENAIPIKIVLAASYVNVDRIDDAEWAVDQIMMLNPQTTLSHQETTSVLIDPELKAKTLEDLRKAGLPE